MKIIQGWNGKGIIPLIDKLLSLRLLPDIAQLAYNQITISIGNIGTDSDFGTTGLSEVVVPRPSTWIQVNHDAGHDLIFEGLEDMPTLQAGYTYRFLMGDNEQFTVLQHFFVMLY